MLLTTLVVGETAPSTTLGTMIVVSGAFLILMLLLKKYAWGAIVDILTQREEKIANDLDSAEQSRVAAAKMEKNVNNNYFLPDQKQLKLLKTRKKVENRLAKNIKRNNCGSYSLTRKSSDRYFSRT